MFIFALHDIVGSESANRVLVILRIYIIYSSLLPLDFFFLNTGYSSDFSLSSHCLESNEDILMICKNFRKTFKAKLRRGRKYFLI